MQAIDLIMWPIQKIIGVRNMPYIFLLPNLIFFGLFVIIPLGANFFFSLSSGDELLFAERELPTTKQYDQLFDCESYLNPNTCTVRFFFGEGFITLYFLLFFKFGLMIFFSVLTAVILNKKIIGRGFLDQYFFPCFIVSCCCWFDLAVDTSKKWSFQCYN